MIDQINAQTGHGVRLICQVLNLPRSSYYHAAQPTPRQVQDRELTELITKVFAEHKRRYGSRRIHAELVAQGLECGVDRVRRLMREAGLRAHQPRSFIPTTSDGRADAPSPNLVLQRPAPTRPNEVWVSDFTYIPCGDAFVYLCVVMDLCSRRVIGWSLTNHMRSDLTTNALRSALACRCHTKGVVIHSDRGSQYASKSFRQLLKTAGLEQSMSARANPYHNAWSESVIGTLKSEMLRGGRFLNLQDAQLEIADYIDGYYNTHRRHSSLNYLSPTAFEAQLALEA